VKSSSTASPVVKLHRMGCRLITRKRSAWPHVPTLLAQKVSRYQTCSAGSRRRDGSMAAMQLWPHSSTCSARQLGTSLMPGQTECAAVTRSSRTRDWLRHHSEIVPAAVNFWQLHANVRAEATKFVLPTMFCAVFHVCPGIF